jgi:predicted nucleic acid-binding protein
METLREHRGIAVTSEITLAEVLAPPTRKDALQLRVKKRVYLDLLLWSQVFNLVPVSRDILIETAHLRTMATLKLPDAIHLVTAIRSNCKFFVCNDGDFKKLPTGMKRVRPNMHEIGDLLRKIA